MFYGFKDHNKYNLCAIVAYFWSFLHTFK